MVIDFFFQSYPLFITISTFLHSVIFKHTFALKLFGLLFVSTNINMALKLGFQQFYKLASVNDSFPILGKGSRPIQNHFCNSLFHSNNKGNKPKTFFKFFGMPSGHAQTSTTFFTCMTFYLLDNYGYNKKTYLLIFSLFAITTGVTVSRVLNDCHTIQQTMVGNIIGVLIGYYGYQLIKKTTRSSRQGKFSVASLKNPPPSPPSALDQE